MYMHYNVVSEFLIHIAIIYSVIRNSETILTLKLNFKQLLHLI